MPTTSEAVLELLNKHTKAPENNPVKVFIGAPRPPLLVWITALLAEELLKHMHPRNRESALRRIAKLAQDILEGAWKLTHQGGALDTRGRVLDFTHRLKAIILADKTKPGIAVPMWVFPDCDPEIFMVIDRGFARNQEHLFIARGGKRHKAAKVCGAARSMLRGIAKGNFKLELEECVEVALENEKIIREVLEVCHYGQKTKCPFYSNGWSGAAVNAAKIYGVEAVKKVLRSYVEQADEHNMKLTSSDPMRVFYEFLRTERENKGKPTGHTRDWMLYPYAVTAFRAALRGQRLNVNRLKSETYETVTDDMGNRKTTFKVGDFGKIEEEEEVLSTV